MKIIYKLRLMAVLLAAMLLFGGVAHAGMQCGEALISDGDTDYSVLKRCGQPDNIVTTTREVGKFVYLFPRQKMRIRDTVIQETWTYDRRSQGGLVYILNFESGHLVSVENQ